jgi:hypothetical protein
MSQTEHYNDAYDGRADWSLDGRHHQAFELTNSGDESRSWGQISKKKRSQCSSKMEKKTIPSVSVTSVPSPTIIHVLDAAMSTKQDKVCATTELTVVRSSSKI